MTRRALRIRNCENADVSHWAQLHLLARIVVGRWVGFVRVRRGIKNVYLDLDHRLLGGIDLVLGYHNGLEVARIYFGVWARYMVACRRVVSGSVHRSTHVWMINATSMRMQSRSNDQEVKFVLRLWKVLCTHAHADHRADQSLAFTALNEERRGILIGTALLAWAQEQSMSLMLVVFIAWAKVAVQDTTVSTLREGLAVVSRARSFEREAWTACINRLGKYSIHASDRDAVALCVAHWQRLLQGRHADRAVQCSAARDTLVNERCRSTVRKAVNLVSRTSLLHCETLFAFGAFSMWSLWVFKWRARGEGVSRQWRLNVSATIGALCCSIQSTVAEMCVAAWRHSITENRHAEVLTELRSAARANSRGNFERFYVPLAEREAHQMVEACYVEWSRQTASVRCRTAERRCRMILTPAILLSLKNAMSLVGVNLPQYIFLTWKEMRAYAKIGRLHEDMAMMASLLQKTSSTIEALRIKLLSMPIYGVVRRKILEAWQYVVTRAKRHVRNSMQEMELVSPLSITSFSPAALQDADAPRLPTSMMISAHSIPARSMPSGAKSSPLQRSSLASPAGVMHSSSPAQRVSLAATSGSGGQIRPVETNRRKAVPV
jgi:hypothetical protein